MSIRTKNGEETTISSRVAELDQLIPQYLGVSKAILDSVIFCHQDDSLWPMSAPTVLKKKFDEIFEAQKYTKAIENIKVIRKKKMDELVMMKAEEKHADERKKLATKAEKKMEELYASIGELTEKHQQVGEQIEEAIEKSKEAWNHAAKFEQILSELTSKIIQEESLKQSIDSISMKMKKMTESDEELHRMQREQEGDVARLGEKKQSLSSRWTETNKDVIKNRSTLGTKQTEVGMHKNATQQYQRQVEARKGLITEIATKYQIRGFGLDINDDQVKEFCEKLNRLAREQKLTCDRARQEIQTEISQAQTALNELSSRQSRLAHSKSSSKSAMDSNDKRIAELQRQISQIDVNDGSKTILESKVQDLYKSCKISKDEFQSANWNAQISAVESKISVLNDAKDSLDIEQAEAAQHAAELGQKNYVSKELSDRQKFLDANIKSNDADFRQLFKEDWAIDGLEQKYRAILNERDEAVKSAELRRDRIHREVEQHESKLREATQTHDDKRQKRDDIAITIQTVLDLAPDSYLAELQDLENAWETTKTDKTKFAVLEDYYKSCIKWTKSRNSCQLCERSVSDSEQSVVLKRMEAKLNKALQALDEEQARELEEEVGNMRDQRANYDTWVALSAEIPELAKALTDLQHRRDEANSSLEAADEEVRDRLGSRREVETLNKSVQGLVKCSQEIAGFKAQLQKIEQKQSSFGGIRATDVIQEEIRQANADLRSTTLELNQLRSGRERIQSQMNTLELDLRDANAQLAKSEHQLVQKAALDAQVTDYKAQNEQARITLKKAEQDLQALAPEMSQAQGRLEDITQRGHERESELQADLVKIKDSIGQFELQSRDINDFINRGGPIALARGTREMEAIEKEISDLESTLVQLGRDVKQVDEDLRTHDDRERKIVDNLAFRANTKKLEALKKEIEKLEATNAASDKSRYAREGEKWHEIRNKLSAEQASYSGEIRTKDDQFKELEETWKLDYQNARADFKKAHITTEVTKCAIEDLGRYAGALDKAIMKYHSVKMEEINRIIQELWRKTYRGSDVDTILIRSENESQKGNKSYNYRVVMVKQDAEMDMRGRCSAGQKVLASIIIRLALAECFSVSSGLIALDEPTTNLDRDNIRSLAQSLHDLIKVRQKQANFQLIIITHDEEFLRYMNCAELCDEYFRVHRNDKQKSQITKQAISEVMR
jgi:DNA repair protein RAD50